MAPHRRGLVLHARPASPNFNFLASRVFACAWAAERLALQPDTISGAPHVGVCVCVSSGVVTASALVALCYRRVLNTFRAVRRLRLYICLSAPWTSAYRGISLCVLLPPHLLVCTAAFQPSCLGLLLAGDKLASRQPEAICHPSSFCSALLSVVCCPVPFWFLPWGPHTNTPPDFPCRPTTKQNTEDG